MRLSKLLMKLLKYDEYSPRVLEIYQDLSSTLPKLIPYSRVDHIGSSAVPGSISKGDLDVLVAVESSEFNEALALIKSIGFNEKEDTLRTDELCMLVTDKYNYDVAVQLIIKGSEFENFITFRDPLLSDPRLVEKYNELKRMSEIYYEDTYRYKKNEFIKSVLASYYQSKTL